MTQQELLTHAPSTAWAPPSTEAVSSWEFPIHCGLGQQGYGKGRLTPRPARGRHGRCALGPANYITRPVSSIFSQLFTCWFFQHFSVSSEKKKPMSESISQAQLQLLFIPWPRFLSSRALSKSWHYLVHLPPWVTKSIHQVCFMPGTVVSTESTVARETDWVSAPLDHALLWVSSMANNLQSPQEQTVVHLAPHTVPGT